MGVSAKKKRKTSNDEEEKEKEPSEPTVDKEIFTVVHFKMMLRDTETVHKGIEQFIEASTADEDYDIIKEYVMSSLECEEIFELIDGQTLKQAELALVFRCCEKILLHIAETEELEDYFTVGKHIVTKLLTQHMQKLTFGLNNKNKAGHIKATLKLLTAMVMLGPMTATLVLNNMNFHDAKIVTLFDRHDVHDKEDVRTCVLHLVIAFLLSEDNNVIRKLLDIKNFLQQVFFRLVYDRIAIIELVLSTVKKKVILNTNVSKTAKAQLFHSKVLHSLGNLYRWKGPTKQKLMQSNQPTPTQEPEKPSGVLAERVSEMVHSFLLEICTSYKHGIIYKDSALGVSTRNNNYTITKFLLSLTLECENPLVGDLVVQSLSSCPQQIHFYLSDLSHKLHPDQNDKWVYFMDIVCRVYEALPKEPHGLGVREQRSIEQTVDLLMLYTGPKQQIISLLTPGFKKQSLVLMHVLLRLVHVCASRAVYILSLIHSDASSRAGQQNWVLDDRSELAAMYKKAVVQTLPEPKVILSCLDVVQKGWDQTRLDNLQDLTEGSLQDVDVRIIQTFCVYQEIYPSMLVDNHLVLTKLIDRVIQEYSADNSLPQIYLLKLLSGTDARRLPWSKQNKQGHSLMYQLLEMVSRLSSLDRVRDLSLQLICKLLLRTGLFDGFEEELPVWIKPLQSQIGLSDKSSSLGYLSSVMTSYMSNPYPYMDKVSDLMSEAALMKTGEQKSQMEDEDRFKAILAMDLDNLDVDLKLEKTTNTAWTGSRRFPFCPMLLTAMDMAKKNDQQYQDMTEYLSLVTVCIFHQQVEPAALCLHVQKLGQEVLLDGVQTYILTWLTNSDHRAQSPKKKKKKRESKSGELLPLKRYTYMIDSNPVIKQADLVKTGSVQQNLLYLTYVLQQTDRDEDSITKVQMILDNICESIDEISRTETMETETSPDIESQPFMEKESQEPVLTSCIKKVLSHPLVMENVFKMEAESSESPELSQITDIMTQFVVQLTESISSKGVIVDKLLEFYHEKVMNVLQSISKSGVNVEDQSSLVSHVYSYLKFMIKDIDMSRCTEVINYILCVPASDDNFTVCSILYSLLTKLTASSLTQLTLVSDKLENLISRFLQAGVRQHMECLADFFQKFSPLSALCPDSLFDSIFRKPVYSRLAIILLQNNNHLQVYLEDILTSEAEEIDAMTYLPVLMEFTKIQAAKLSTDQIKMSESIHAITNMYRPLMIELAGIKSCDNVLPVFDLFNLLLDKEALDAEFMEELEKTVLATLQHKKTFKLRKHHVQLADKLLTSPLLQKDSNINLQLLIICFDCLRNCLIKLDTRNNEVEEQLWEILARIPKEDMETFPTAWSDFKEAWPGFIRKVLKNFYTTSKALIFLTKLIPVVYAPEAPDHGVPIVTLFYMFTNHTSFLPVLFNEGNTECKGALIDVLLEIVQISPSLCESAHVTIYLGAYGATMSLTDQKILKLIHFYEKQGIDFFQFRPFLWGQEAIEFQMLRKNDKKSLVTMKMGKILTGINQDRMKQTILNFPLTRKLQTSDPIEADKCRGLSTTYDPCFFLPFFSFLLAPNRYVQCKKFVDHDCLGLVFASLSSHDKTMRSAAYHVLDRFQVHLKEAKFQGQEELTYLFRLLRNSLTEPNSKLAPLITIFLARAAKLLFEPGNHMYTVIKSFLMAKPTLDVSDIPEFYKLFNSSDEEHKLEKSWILSLMQEGLREISDFRIFEKRYSFKVLFCFYDSETADTESQIKILQMIKTACRDRMMALSLYNNHGLLTWISLTITKLSPDKKRHISELVNIIHCLWFTMLGRISSNKDKTGQPDTMFVTQMMNIVQSIQWYFREMRKDVIGIHLKTLLSVRDHLSRSEVTLAQKGKQIMSASLTYTDLLVLILYVNRLEDSDMALEPALNILNRLGYSTNLLQRSKTENSRMKKLMKPGEINEEKSEADVKQTESRAGGKKGDKECDGDDKGRDISDSLMAVIVKGTYFECESSQKKLVAASFVLIQWIVGRFQKGYNTDLMVEGLRFIDHITTVNSCVMDTLCSNTTTGTTVLSGLLNLYALLHSQHDQSYAQCVQTLNRIIVKLAQCKFGGLNDGLKNESDRSVWLQTIFATGTIMPSKDFVRSRSSVSVSSGAKHKSKGVLNVDIHQTPKSLRKKDKPVSKELLGVSETVDKMDIEEDVDQDQDGDSNDDYGEMENELEDMSGNFSGKKKKELSQKKRKSKTKQPASRKKLKTSK